VNNANAVNARAKLVSGLCLGVLICILVAGLWPLHVPRNAVSWLISENGMRFERHGSIVSASAFRNSHSPSDAGNSLEIWLTPEQIRSGGSILAFDSSPNPQGPFLVRQYGTSIAVQRSLVDERGKVSLLWFKVEHVFEEGRKVFVTITSNRDHTDLYVNGVVAGRSLDPGIVSRELTGRLVLANSTVDDSWTGEIRGLAIYDCELTPAEVSNHFRSWTPDHGPVLTGERSPSALYLFNERKGSTVHNLADSATDLAVPVKYFVLHPAFLHSTWGAHTLTRQAWNHWSVWEDLGINIVGFVPVGFVFSAYFSSVNVKRTGRAALIVVLLGFFMSFIVESLQWFLPNRDSGMDDIFTNTTGTALGVVLYRSSTLRRLWSQALNFAVPLQKPVATRSSDAQHEKLTLSA
jgi:hypothetical protein